MRASPPKIKTKPPVHSGEVRDAVRRMWVTEGKSYKLIGSILNISGAAVGGLVNRMKLPKRDTSTTSKPPRPRNPPVDKIVRLVSAATAELERTAERTAYDAAPALDANAKPHTILTIKDGMCRWPVDGYGVSATFCGHGIVFGSPYCAPHKSRAVAPKL